MATKIEDKQKGKAPKEGHDFENLARLAELSVTELVKAGATDATAGAYQGVKRQVKFANSALVLASAWSGESIHLFASFDRRIVSTSVREITQQGIKDAVGKLAKLSRQVEPNPEFEGLATGPFTAGKAPNYDQTLEEPGEKGVELVELAVQTAQQEGAKRVAGVLELHTSREFLATSAGARLESKDSGAYFSVRALVDKESTGAQALCSRTLSRLPVEAAARKAGQIAKLATTKATVAPGVYDTIWEPLPLAALLNRVGDSASIFSVEAGFSFLAQKLGKKVANEAVTLYDDATLPEGFSSTPFDHEGTTTSRKDIIDKGVLDTYLHNHSTATRHKTHSTGNAGIISPQPWNLVLAPGKTNQEKMVEGMERGILVTNVWYTRFANYLTGDFSTIPRDGLFLIEDGEVKGTLKGLRVSDNLQRFLEGMSCVAKEPVNIKSWEADTPTLTPSAWVDGVRFTASTK